MKLFRSCFIIGLFFLTFCTQPVQKVSVLNPETASELKITLSDLATDISYIPLSNEVPIRLINRVAVTDSFIFVGSNPSGLLAFDHQGKLVRQIGRIGNGPGEYHHGSSFSLDRKHKRVCLLDRNNVLEYTVDGRFTKEFSILKFGNDFQDIQCQDGLIYLFEPVSFGNAKYEWLIVDENGNEVFAKYNFIPKFKSNEGGDCHAFSDGHMLYYMNSYNDTIFAIKGKDYQAKYLMAKGKYSPLIDEPGSQGGDFNLLDIIRTRENLLMRYYLNNFFWLTLFNEKEGKLIVLDKIQQINHRDEGPGIINDLDGGLPFVPKFQILMKDASCLCGYRYSYELKNAIASDAFKNSVPKLAERKKQLEKLADRLDENDNPVLMVVKLKKILVK